MPTPSADGYDKSSTVLSSWSLRYWPVRGKLATRPCRPLRIRHSLPGTQQPFGLLHCLHALRLLTLRISSACTRKKSGRIIWVARPCGRRRLALRRLAHGSGRRVTFRTSRSLPLSGFGHRRRRGMLTRGASRPLLRSGWLTHCLAPHVLW